jgi:hypothetical protein
MIGGTFGVAVMGALVAAIGLSNLDSSLPRVPAGTRAAIANSLGSGGTIPGAHLSHHVVTATNDAFVAALGTGLTVSAIVAGVAAVVAWLLIEPKAKASAPELAEPQFSAETAARELAA